MKTQHQKISIIGLGWLGASLAQHLTTLGYEVYGTCTTEDKCAELHQQGIRAMVCKLPNDSLPMKLVIGSAVVIVCIPPSKLKLNYVEVMQKLSQQFREFPKVIFVSSTSVYADNNTEIDELSPAIPITENGKLLRTCEDFFLQQQQYVVRLAGLYGERRYPGKWFAGKKGIPNGLAPINMISLLNCISLFTQLIQKEIPNQVINGVEQNHSTRMEFYIERTKGLGLELPEFIPELKEWKKVSSKFFKL